jgi:mutator protein MutT
LSTAEILVPVRVVAGVLKDDRGRILLAQRPAGKHLAGGWEFPGGKLEPGESRLAGLRRELREEIGVALQAAHPLMRLIHTYPNRLVELDVWAITSFAGEPRSLDGQQLSWCDRDALLQAQLLPADRPVVTALLLPERIVASTGPLYRIAPADTLSAQRQQAHLVGTFCDGPLDTLQAAAGGADFIVLRHRLGDSQLMALCAGLNVPVYAHGIGLPEAWAMGASGVSDLAG